MASPCEPAPASSFILNLQRFPESLVHTKEGIGLIASILGRYRDVSLYTISESMAGWLVSNRTELELYTRLLLQDKDVVTNILSKEQQAGAAEKAGLSLLNTYYLTGDTQSLSNIRKEDYPLCIRPSGPGSVRPSFKVEIASDKNSLEEFMSGRKYAGRGIMAQPFLNTPNLVVHGSRRQNGKTIGLQGFLVERKFEGLTLTIRPLDLPEHFLSKCVRFTEIMKIVGPYHFEFLWDKEAGTSWFLEVNARLGGTTAKVYALGYDEPGYLLDAWGYPVKIQEQILNRTAASKMVLLKYLLFTLKGKITPLDYPHGENRIHRIIMAAKGLAVYTDDILSLRDVKSAFSIYSGSIRAKLDLP